MKIFKNYGAREDSVNFAGQRPTDFCRYQRLADVPHQKPSDGPAVHINQQQHQLGRRSILRQSVMSPRVSIGSGYRDGLGSHLVSGRGSMIGNSNVQRDYPRDNRVNRSDASSGQQTPTLEQKPQRISVAGRRIRRDD